MEEGFAVHAGFMEALREKFVRNSARRLTVWSFGGVCTMVM